MRKRFVGLGIGMTAALTVLMGMTAMAAQVNEEGAKNIALEHAGVAQDQVSYMMAKLDYEKGRQVYDVEFFTKDYKEYDYEISVEDGAILSYDYDAEAAFWSNLPAENREISITLDKAKEIALNHAGLKAEDVTFVKEGLEYDDGLASYEVEFYTADYKEYDYEISAYTGEIVSYDYDAEYQNFNVGGQIQKTAPQASVTADQAKATALETAGLDASQVTHMNIRQDYDDGRLVYEGKFFHDTMEYEFEIDASTGRVVDWDMESIFD